MSDLIRLFRQREAEQEALQVQRQMARMVRAGRQSAPESVPIYNPPLKPLGGGGVQPVWVLNMPRGVR